jgi:hypothetical protein
MKAQRASVSDLYGSGKGIVYEGYEDRKGIKNIWGWVEGRGRKPPSPPETSS